LKLKKALEAIHAMLPTVGAPEEALTKTCVLMISKDHPNGSGET
jgi:hypothetical protein